MCDLIKEFSKFHQMNEEATVKLLKNRPESYLLCACGDFKKIYYVNKKYLSAYKCCGRKECEPNYGKLRPEHSTLMKEKAKESGTVYSKNLMQKKQIFNKEVNTIAFFEKQMINAKFPYEKDKIMKCYGKFRSGINRSSSYRLKRISTIFNKANDFWKEIILEILGFDPSQEDIVDVDKTYLLLHGIQSQMNMEKKIKTGTNSFYKREVVSDLKYHKKGVTCVITRSSTEAKYIRLFEKEQICWDYEHILIRSKYGLYKPDFEILVDNQKYMIEVKGTFYRTTKEEYFTKKIIPALEYCKKNNMVYCLTFLQNPKNLGFLKTTRITGEADGFNN